MESIHFMVPEDEILLCGMALLVGVVLGLAVGLVRAYRARRAA